MTIIPNDTRIRGTEVRVKFLPIELRRFLDLTASSRNDAERRLFWHLVPHDNGAPHEDSVLFTEGDLRELRGLAEHEGACSCVIRLLDHLQTFLELHSIGI